MICIISYSLQKLQDILAYRNLRLSFQYLFFAKCMVIGFLNEGLENLSEGTG